MLDAESSEDGGDIGFLNETDSGTNFIMVDHDAKELACRSEVLDLIFFREFCLDLDRGDVPGDGLDDQVDFLLISGSEVGELNFLLSPAGLFEKFVHGEGFDEMTELA